MLLSMAKKNQAGPSMFSNPVHYEFRQLGQKKSKILQAMGCTSSRSRRSFQRSKHGATWNQRYLHQLEPLEIEGLGAPLGDKNSRLSIQKFTHHDLWILAYTLFLNMKMPQLKFRQDVSHSIAKLATWRTIGLTQGIQRSSPRGVNINQQTFHNP